MAWPARGCVSVKLQMLLWQNQRLLIVSELPAVWGLRAPALPWSLCFPLALLFASSPVWNLLLFLYESL